MRGGWRSAGCGWLRAGAGARLLRQERTRAAGHPNLPGEKDVYPRIYARKGRRRCGAGGWMWAGYGLAAAGAGARGTSGWFGWFGVLRGRVRRGAFLAPGCSIIRVSLTVALMVSLPRFGSLWAFGPTAHRADASLRALRALATLGRSLVRRKDGPCHSERSKGRDPLTQASGYQENKGHSAGGPSGAARANNSTARAALEGPNARTTAQRGRPLTAAERARRRYVGY